MNKFYEIKPIVDLTLTTGKILKRGEFYKVAEKLLFSLPADKFILKKGGLEIWGSALINELEQIKQNKFKNREDLFYKLFRVN
jgi:hypothetical protein